MTADALAGSLRALSPREEVTVVRLDGLRTRKRYTAHLACIGGCLDYLGFNVSDGWLWGGTGHAFLINVHPTLCPSGPTAWHHDMLFELAGNLGYSSKGVFAIRSQADDAFADAQKRAWDMVRQALDTGKPCYGWEVWPFVPDYFVINGYDDVGYYYTGYREGGPTPWNELGTHDVQVLEAYVVEPCEPSTPETVVRSATRAALSVVEQPKGTLLAGYVTGPAAFDVWAGALRRGTASYDGSAYNACVWGECRELAAAFLGEAREKLAPTPGSQLAHALDAAAGAYRAVADSLRALLSMHPDRGNDADWTTPLKSTEGATLMQGAAAAEAEGLAALARIAGAL